jgi:hypothetical protein
VIFSQEEPRGVPLGTFPNRKKGAPPIRTSATQTDPTGFIPCGQTEDSTNTQSRPSKDVPIGQHLMFPALSEEGKISSRRICCTEV